MSTDNAVALMALASGVSIYDLTVLTRKSEDAIKVALSQVPPIRGVRGQARVYDLAQALPAIYANDSLSAERVAEAIKKMKPSQLPTGLQKEFWAALNARKDYLTDMGQLWRQERVMALIAKLLGVMRQSMTLLVDNTDQRSPLNPKQAQFVRDTADSVLLGTQTLAKEAFADWQGDEDREDLDPATYEPPVEEEEIEP